MLGLRERLARELEGRYDVQRELGEGGMAVVYLAEDLRHRRPVAVKVLRPEVAEALGSERFLREIEIAARLNHPRIIPLLESGAGEGLLYYVMPFIEGESLRARLDRDRQLPVEDAVAIASQMARALAHAHDRGVVHRDVKPGNVLLVGGEAVVADFGIARAVATAGGDKLTETGMVVGTPAYMSPEQASADRNPDARTDIYSLGCVLYEMLTGEPPFTGSTAQAVTARKLSQPPPDPAVVRETVSPELSRIVGKALAPAAADRYATADDLGDALARIGPVPVSAVDGGGRDERRGLLGRPSGRLARGAVVAILVAVALWGWLRPSRDASPDRATRVPIMLPADVNVTRDVAAGSALAVSPDGRTVVIVGTDAEGRRLYRRSQDELQAMPIPGTDGAGSPFFSPDGMWIGFFADGRLRRTPIDGGSPVDIAAAPDVPMGASWGSAGRIVFASGYRGSLHVVSADGGEPEPLTAVDVEAGELSHRHPAFLPDGRTVLFVVFGAGLEIYAVDVRTGDRAGPLTEGIAPRYAGGHLFLGRGSTLFGARFSPDAVALEGPVVPLVERVTNELEIAAMHYAVSEGGTIAHVPGSEGGGLVLRSPDGTERALPDLGRTRRPRFSPDGSRLAAGIGGDVWIHELDSMDDPVRVTFDGGEAPVWTPGGSHITYGIQGEGLFTRPVDGGGGRQQILDIDLWTQPVGWTPDGRVLAFAMDEPERSGGCIWALIGDDSRCFVEIQGWWSRLSPDGRWLAYETQGTGRTEVSVRSFPDGDVRYQISQRGGSSPAWGSDGLEVYYRSGARLMAARVDTAGGMRVESRRVVMEPFRVRRPDDYDVHPDGTLALVRPLQGTREGDVVAAFNWFPELRGRTAR